MGEPFVMILPVPAAVGVPRRPRVPDGCPGGGCA
uniref:Uncharacterized protein n=1 Tax=Arundo donax TaxID=35708 RepID=A0A0A9C0J3_ARUDO